MSGFEVEHLPGRMLGVVDLSQAHGVAAMSSGHVEVLDLEYADGDRGLKIVYSGQREDGKGATFETGSFFDNGGVDGAQDRHDICVSTAGGCTRTCNFCSVPASSLGFERLLTADEMVAQVLHTIELRNPEGSMPNVVGIMGNGEPPDNPALVHALRYLDESGVVDRTTISTIGENVRGIGLMASALAGLTMPTRLQLSLHAADPEKRRLLIPGRRTINDAVDAADDWTLKTGQPVKYNVVLMEGTGAYEGFSNATVSDAERLAEVLHADSRLTEGRLPRRLKLSAFNPVPGIPFRAPDNDVRHEFVQTLVDLGVTDIKTFRGSGINIDPLRAAGGFACGQLRATTAALVLERRKTS